MVGTVSIVECLVKTIEVAESVGSVQEGLGGQERKRVRVQTLINLRKLNCLVQIAETLLDLSLLVIQLRVR